MEKLNCDDTSPRAPVGEPGKYFLLTIVSVSAYYRISITVPFLYWGASPFR